MHLHNHILHTKIVHPPLKPHTIPRHRILNQIDADSKPFPLTLVTAPCGSGKTTLARQWISGRETQSAWCSLDSADNEFSRFWSYIITSLQQVDESLGRGSIEILRSARFIPQTEQAPLHALIPLINDLLSLNQNLYLVIDDFHIITDDGICKSMEFAIEHMPANVRMAILTQTKPSFPLSRWRAQGRMIDIDQRTMQFTRKETAMYLRSSLDRVVSKQQIDTVHNKTSGWPAALQLVATSFATTSDPIGHISDLDPGHHVFNFLTNDILHQQEEHIQEFLLATCMLPRLCASLCDAVTVRSDSEQILLHLHDNGIFINQLDQSWYSYQPLFSVVLRNQLETRDKEYVNALLNRAGEWFYETDDPAEAIGLFMKAGSYERAATIICEHADRMWERQGAAQLATWLAKLPASVIDRYPRLIAYHALISVTEGNWEQAQTSLDNVSRLCNEADEDVNGMIAVAHGLLLLLQGDLKAGMVHVQRALSLLPDAANHWRIYAGIVLGDVKTLAGDLDGAFDAFKGAYRWSRQIDSFLATVSAGINLMKIMWMRGELEQVCSFGRKLLQMAQTQNLAMMPRIGIVWMFIGEVLREQGDLQEAERCIMRGASIARPERLVSGISMLFEVMLNVSQKEFDQALECLSSAERLSMEAGVPEAFVDLLGSWKARILLAKGDLPAAKDIMQSPDLDDMSTVHFPGNVQLMMIQLLLAEDKLQAAGKRIALVEGLSHYGTSRLLRVRTLLLKAQLELQRGYELNALQIVKDAACIGNSYGFYQVFIDEGQELAPLIGQLSGSAEVGEYSRGIIAGFSAKKTPSDNSNHEDLAEKLSPRELQILSLISRGLSNKDISEALAVSVQTVKWHNSNIFGKLGVKNRTQAAARARELGLLS